jgi:hypothetical protein
VRRIIEGVAYTLLAEGPPIEEGDPQAEEAGPTAVITVHNYAGALRVLRNFLCVGSLGSPETTDERE